MLINADFCLVYHLFRFKEVLKINQYLLQLMKGSIIIPILPNPN